jgi:hypothetical protein
MVKVVTTTIIIVMGKAEQAALSGAKQTNFLEIFAIKNVAHPVIALDSRQLTFGGLPNHVQTS